MTKLKYDLYRDTFSILTRFDLFPRKVSMRKNTYNLYTRNYIVVEEPGYHILLQLFKEVQQNDPRKIALLNLKSDIDYIREISKASIKKQLEIETVI